MLARGGAESGHCTLWQYACQVRAVCSHGERGPLYQRWHHRVASTTSWRMAQSVTIDRRQRGHKAPTIFAAASAADACPFASPACLPVDCTMQGLAGLSHAVLQGGGAGPVTATPTANMVPVKAVNTRYSWK